ncbi:MAG TPA: hypothetical protein VK850_02300, partial [Candidatus Binatia bacterium]|nr:hypothetical protein [Candidatus Binatia bacterium]
MSFDGGKTTTEQNTNYMKKLSLYKSVCVAALALGLSTAVQAQNKHAAEKMSVEDAVLISVTARVQAVDLEKRELTLKDSLGNENTLTVDKAVKRLDEVKVGDDVTAKYYLSVAAELREPTAEE